MGIRAALVAPDRPRGGCTVARRSCSALVAYCSWLVTPRSIQTACCGVVFVPRLISRWLAVANDGPRMPSSLSTFHLPVAPATKAARTIGEAFSPRGMIGPLHGSDARTDKTRPVQYIASDRGRPQVSSLNFVNLSGKRRFRVVKGD